MHEIIEPEARKKSENLIDNCMLFAFKQIDDKHIDAAINSDQAQKPQKAENQKDLLLTGLEGEVFR